MSRLSSLNREMARCMPRLISFAIALSCCTARDTSENFIMKISCPQWDSIPDVSAYKTCYPFRD